MNPGLSLAFFKVDLKKFQAKYMNIASVSAMVKDFMEKHRQEVHKSFTYPIRDIQNLRLRLITEEYNELVDAWNKSDSIGIADALADLVYVIYGMAHAYGIPLDEVIQEVHKSNMTKPAVGIDDSEKVEKGDDYVPPNLASILFPPV